MTVIVADTSVFVAALLGPGGASREGLRRCLKRSYEPLMGAALIDEYEDVLSRAALFEKCVLTAKEREALLDAFLSVCRWTRIYYRWRPNLPSPFVCQTMCTKGSGSLPGRASSVSTN